LALTILASISSHGRAPASLGRYNRGKIVRSRLLALVGGLMLAVMLAEGVLRAREHVRTSEPITDPDALLGVRNRPAAAGHDSRGFRNRVALASACVVVIGDSQTWGVNVSVDQAWPQQLQVQTGLDVYNMSLGGYGVAQYVALFDEALGLRPDTVIIALYPGNDLWETYRTIYELDHWAPLRLPAESLSIADDPVKAAADRHWVSKRRFVNGYGRWPPTKWHLWLLSHTAIGRLIDRLDTPIRQEAWAEAARAWASASDGDGAIYAGPNNGTVFTLRYRLSALDVEEPRIQEGLRLTLVLLQMARAKAGRTGTKLVLLLIPTKERVYAAAFPGLAAHVSGAYPVLVEKEEIVFRSLVQQSAELGLPLVDTTASLADGVRAGGALYPKTEDGHPVALGYAAIADAARRTLDGDRQLTGRCRGRAP
jgi:lysophospholipase L1-like esterase